VGAPAREKADGGGKLEVMPKPKAKKKKKSAIDTLVDSLMQLREEARQRMTAEEFEEADRQVHELANRIRKRRLHEVTEQGITRLP
jgi:hypothetical protein